MRETSKSAGRGSERSQTFFAAVLSGAVMMALVACAAPSLQTAARAGSVAQVRGFLAAGEDVNQRDERGNTPLYQAARSGSVAVVKLLLEHGADVDSDNDFGSTALHVAGRYGHVAVIKELIAHGATIDAVNFARQDLLAGGRRLAAEAQGQRAGVTPLVRAAKAGHRAAVEALVEAGATLPAPQAIRAASLAGNKEIAAYLTKAARDRPAGGRAPVRFSARYQRRIAAVVGISRYRSWPPLEGASKDARRMAEALRSMDFDEVIELYDDNASRNQILSMLGERLPQETGSDDLVLIYFAGHGQTETLPSGEKRGYVIPTDGSAEDSFATGISMKTLRDLSNRLTARHVFFLMDACYSGLGLNRDTKPTATRGDAAAKRAVRMLTAGSEGQQALERGGRGLFTTYLLRALSGEADENGDGMMTASEIGAFVAPQVTNASGNRQTPLYGTLDGAGELALEVPR